MTNFDPPWLLTARSLLGTHEAAGPANSPAIMGWAKRLGLKALGIAYNADSVPWCGLFVANCLQNPTLNPNFGFASALAPPSIAVRASSWSTWGANLGPSVLAPGSVLVFKREGGGHVGFYVGEDATHYHVLGGNQGDAVNIMRIAKNRCVARRWPRGVPVIGKPVRMTGAAGIPISTDEA